MKDRIDEMDFKILSLLADNAQMPYTEVAKRRVFPQALYMPGQRK